MTKPQLLFIGSPLLDVSMTCEQEYLQGYELKPDDCVLAKDIHSKLFSEALQDAASTTQAGGSAQNSARVCKRILRDKGIVSFAGCVGDDDVANKMEQHLQHDGVQPLYAKHESLATGVCVCLVGSNGERSMVTSLGAAASYNVNYLNTVHLQRAMEEADIIFVVGYFLSHSPDVVKTVAKFCQERKKLFALSLSAPYVCKAYRGLLMDCMPLVDFVFGNCEEAKAFLDGVVSTEEGNDLKACAETIAQFPKKDTKTKRVVVITNGSSSATVCETGEAPKKFSVPKVENFVDGTGCGDALAGGFLATYIVTGSISSAIRSGINVAAEVAQVRGCGIS